MASINILGLLCLLFVTAVKSEDIEADIKRNVTELITSKGYPVETYEVQTADGYILSLQRIPHGKRNTTSNGKVVYLQHGLLGASSDWVLNNENLSIALVLADAGYDVWMGNVRGNTYSRKHIKYNPSQSEFWQFSFDEMAKYDVPAMIDFALKVTGKQQLYYIGHSQGTTVMFAMLADNPEYNKKVKLAIALAPVVFEGNIKGFIQFLSPFGAVIQSLLHLIGQDEFMPSATMMSTASKMFCKTPYKIICSNVVFLIGGTNTEQLNEERLPVYASHFPEGTSAINMVHHTQLQNSGRFQKYDHGFYGNYKKYGQISPPQYPLENITTPVALLWSENDNLGDPEDVGILKSKLKNLVRFFKVQLAKWNHFDFVLAKEADKYLYKEILNLLETY